jgi:hypothetical protein
VYDFEKAERAGGGNKEQNEQNDILVTSCFLFHGLFYNFHTLSNMKDFLSTLPVPLSSCVQGNTEGQSCYEHFRLQDLLLPYPVEY